VGDPRSGVTEQALLAEDEDPQGGDPLTDAVEPVDRSPVRRTAMCQRARRQNRKIAAATGTTISG
jgi:hypothetical protein